MLDLCQNWLRNHGPVLVLYVVVTLSEPGHVSVADGVMHLTRKKEVAICLLV